MLSISSLFPPSTDEMKIAGAKMKTPMLLGMVAKQPTYDFDRHDVDVHMDVASTRMTGPYYGLFGSSRQRFLWTFF